MRLDAVSAPRFGRSHLFVTHFSPQRTSNDGLQGQARSDQGESPPRQRVLQAPLQVANAEAPRCQAQQAARAAPPQQAQYDEPASYQPQGYDQGYEQPRYDQFQDPYAGSQPMTQRAYSNESAPERRPSSERQRSNSGRSQSQPRGLPSGGPRPQRRPTNEMPPAQDQYQQPPPQAPYGGGEYGGGGGYDYQQPTYDRDPPRDFNPHAASPQPQQARSQYSPAPPRVTRQRSISGGQRVSLDDGRPGDAPRYAPPSQQGQQQPQYTRAPPSRSSEKTRQRTTSDETEDPYAYSEKGSTVNLVERGGGMEMQQRGGKKGGGPARSKPKPKRGGPTIKMGDVPHEEMGSFFSEVRTSFQPSPPSRPRCPK